VRTGVFLVLVARAPATVWKVSRSGAGVIHHLEKTRQFVKPLLVSDHRSHVGACDDQDQRSPAVRCSGDPQRPRVRRLRRGESRPRLREGGELLHSGQRARAPGSDRRHLVRTRDDRAPEPGRRPVELLRVLVLRAQHRRAAAKPLCLRLLDLPGRVQPEPAVRLRRGDGSIVQHRGGPHPIPARRAQGAHAVRQQRPSAPQTWFRPIAATGSRDRATSVEPNHLQGPLRTVDAEGLHQRRTRPALRGDRRRCRAYHHRAAHRPRQGHRPPHQRNPHTTTRPATQALDPDRPRLRSHPRRHADPCSTTSASHASQPPHRQHLVDRVPASL
jgi:hypothetical protein